MPSLFVPICLSNGEVLFMDGSFDLVADRDAEVGDGNLGIPVSICEHHCGAGLVASGSWSGPELCRRAQKGASRVRMVFADPELVEAGLRDGRPLWGRVGGVIGNQQVRVGGRKKGGCSSRSR